MSSVYNRFYRNSLRVLAYHEVPDKKRFEKQIKYLTSNYNVISLIQLEKLILGKKKIPKNSVLITFDDGDYSNYSNAFPILKKYNVPSVIFIISELINTDKTFWCRWVEAVYEKKGKSYSEARKEIKRLKNISNRERMKALGKLPALRSKQLGLKEIKEMESYSITMANHTHTHPMIDKCTEEEILKELVDVRENFDLWGLKGYPFFAYPNGNIDIKAEQVLLENGVKMAFLFDHRINKGTLNPMRISRIRVNADAPLEEFKVKVSGLHSLLMRIKNNLK